MPTDVGSNKILLKKESLKEGQETLVRFFRSGQ